MPSIFQWPESSRVPRHRLHPDVVAAIEAVGAATPKEADIETVIVALRSHGLGFVDCMDGVIVLRQVSPRDAKMLVHRSEAHAEQRADREAFWADLHDGLDQMTRAGETQPASTETPQDVQQGSTAAGGPEPL